MSDAKKFTPEELQTLTELRKRYETKILEFGQLELEIMLTDRHVEDLKKAKTQIQQDYLDLQEEERKLLETFNLKYGSGTVDVATGEFTPNAAQ